MRERLADISSSGADEIQKRSEEAQDWFNNQRMVFAHIKKLRQRYISHLSQKLDNRT